MEKKTLFILDIENIKGHYSRCLELIMSLEQNDPQKINGALNRFNEVKTNSVRLFSSSDNIPPPRVIENEVLLKSHIFSISPNFENDPQNTKYHIRIKINNNIEYSELQYFALLLKRLEYMTEANPASQEHRLTLFFNSNFDIYNALSLYLRLIAKETTGTIFSKDNGEVSAIDFKEYVGKSDFIPLIPIDVDSYNELTKTIISDTFDKLLNMRSGGRFGNSRNENPKIALSDFLIEASYYKLKEIYENEKEILKKLITRISDSTITLMHFVIFALLIKKYYSNIIINNNIDDDYFNMVYTLAEDIYIGIRQIIENVIQHSETKSGFFQLLLKKEDGKELLEIRVSDLNKEETLVDNFKKKLEYEKENEEPLSTVCETLLGFGEKIGISDFFIDVKDTGLKDAWDKYREKIGMRHFGLRIFNDTLLSCKSYFQIVSNTGYKFDKKYLYSNDKNNKYDYDDLIPGTDVFASIPLSEDNAKKDIFGSAQLNYFDETYECFASFLDYQAIDKTTDLFNIFLQNRKSREKDSDFNAGNPALKEDFTEMWATSFNQLKKQIMKYELFFINLEKYFYDPKDTIIFGNSEVFSRGIFRGLLLRESDCKSYIAIINADKIKNDIMSQIKVRGGFRDTSIDPSIQLFLHIKNTEESFTLFGNTVQNAIQNAYLLSLEHGLGLFKYNDLHPASGFTNDNLEIKTQEDIKVMPFDVLVITKDDKEIMSLFDKKIKFIANKEIDSNENANAGFLIKDTHTRLGSKIHIDGFFEMSFLFYRTSIANRVSFEIIRNIKKNGIDIKKDKLLFYGYASYSKAIITSLVEIVNVYRNNLQDKVRFVVYQHNLQTETSKDEIQLFHGHEDNPYIIPKETNIIQIVPISSTFTTFNKMWNKFQRIYSKVNGNDWLNKYDPVLNYTVFWVFDDKCSVFSEYVKQFNYSERKIKTDINLVKNNIQFLIGSRLKWHSPLDCNKCFPEKLTDEKIIVETDKTSTIPAQQLRLKKNSNSKFTTDKQERERNNTVLLKLLNSNCIKYGHILRGKNHFQYYINTQDFFYKTQQEIMSWLKGLKSIVKSGSSKLNIIFVPEHNTNVGFAQFVNIYCFNGTAEVISINIDKEYRTNFICEHKAIKATIKILLDLWDPERDGSKCPVEFYFVDDSIITGSTFDRANDLLLSLLPKDKKRHFSTNLFTKIFVLIDRLSMNSKNAYVINPEENFHSFLHIDISSMRTSGDSCVCCKLRNEAERLFAQSSTKKIAEYWYKKISSRNAVSFDEEGKNDLKATLRLLISHIANNYLFNDNNSMSEDDLINRLYDKFLFDENFIDNMESPLFNGNFYDVFHYSLLLGEIKKECKNPIKRIGILTKIISRPYFSFDSKFKQAILKYLLKLSDDIFKNNLNNKIVQCLQNINDRKKIAFLINVVLKSLADLKSTYYLRKETIKNIAYYVDKLNVDESCIEKFYMCFAALIHSAIDCGNDETKSLWFEYLLLFGDEYNEKNEYNFDFKSIYSSFFTDNGLTNTEIMFKYFCDELFLMNTSVLFKGIEMCKNANEKQSITEQKFDYFMNNWKKFRKINKTQVDDMNNLLLISEINLFKAIDELNEHNNANKSLKERYENVFKQLTETYNKKYNSVVTGISYALLTPYAKHTSDNSDKKTTISDFDIISMTDGEQVNPENSLKKYRIKKFICENINNSNDLHNWGYKIHYEKEEDGNDNFVKIVMFFNNPENRNNKFEYYSKREIKKIAPVYLFIDYQYKPEILDNNAKEKYSLLILRDILMYRNRFMRAFESDFSSEIFGQYAHKSDETNLMAHEKALSHATTSDDATEYEIMKSKISDDKLLDEEKLLWTIFKSYVNRQIGKLYCRNFNKESSDNENATPLYIIKDKTYDKSSKKAFMYEPIENLSFLKEDNRFEWFRKIADIEILDNNVFSKRLFENSERCNYNREYLLCLIFDIIFTGIKYSTGIYYTLNDLVDIFSTDTKQEKPKVEFKIDKNYLVINNPVVLGTHTANITDYKDRNKIIKYRLENPIDFPDGRMSLGVIKKYIEGLYKDEIEQPSCSFEFIKVNENNETPGRAGERERLYFETRLPIFDNIGENKK